VHSTTAFRPFRAYCQIETPIGSQAVGLGFAIPPLRGSFRPHVIVTVGP
jgi:hypothetical protein